MYNSNGWQDGSATGHVVGAASRPAAGLHQAPMQNGDGMRARATAGGHPGSGSAPSLSDLSVEATRQQYELEQLLHPEMRHGSAGAPPKKDEESVDGLAAKLADFSRTLDAMERLLASEPPQQRTISAKRLQSYRARLSEFSAKLERRRSRLNRRVYQEEQRQQLFGDRESSEVLNMINGYHEENGALNRSNTMAAQAIAQGISIVENLKEQGMTLRRASEKLKDIAGVLGLSNSLIRVIERREYGDAMIVYGGMGLTVVFLYFVYWMTG